MQPEKKSSPIIPILIGVVVLVVVVVAWFGKQKADRINAEREAQIAEELRAKQEAKRAEIEAKKAAAAEAERKKQEEKNKPPDKYAWICKSKNTKRLHMVVDCTRCDDLTVPQIVSQRMQALVLNKYTGRVKMVTRMIELNDAALKNANLLFCSMGIGNPYDASELAAIRKFLDRGGFVFVCGNLDLQQALLKVYGLETERVVKDSTPRGCVELLQDSCIENCDNCREWVACIDKSNGWYPIVGWDDESGHAAMACKDVGKGKIIWASMNFMIGSTEDQRGQNWNVCTLAKLLGCMSNAGVEVKYEEPFRDMKLTESPVKVAGDGFTVYSCESLKKCADRAKDDLNKIMPVISNMLGVAFVNQERCYVLAKSEYSKSGWSSSHFSEFQMMRMLPYLPDNTPSYSLLLDDVTLWYKRSWERCWGSNYEPWDTSFHHALSAIIAKRAGYEKEGNAKIMKIMAAGKEFDPDLRHFSWYGKALQGGDNLQKGIQQVRDAKACAILLLMLKDDPDIVTKYYAHLKELAHKNLMTYEFTMDQMAAVYSELLKKDMFPVFKKFGIILDPQKGVFKLPEKKE